MTPDYCELDPEGDLIFILERRHEDDACAPSSQPPAKKHSTGKSQQIRMKVSSRHLALSSTVFRTSLRSGFKEAVTLRTTGTVEIPLPDDHPAAFLILLNVVHGHTRQVPRRKPEESTVVADAAAEETAEER